MFCLLYTSARRYSYSEKKDTLKVPEEVQVAKGVVDEEGEAGEEKRNGFGGSTQDDKKTSVDTVLQDSKLSLIHI